MKLRRCAAVNCHNNTHVVIVFVVGNFNTIIFFFKDIADIFRACVSSFLYFDFVIILIGHMKQCTFYDTNIATILMRTNEIINTLYRCRLFIEVMGHLALLIKQRLNACDIQTMKHIHSATEKLRPFDLKWPVGRRFSLRKATQRD